AYALTIPISGEWLHLVEQYRYPLERRRWEFPQGTAPDLETVPPADLARRELHEETGLLARTMTNLGALDVAPGMSSQRRTAFLATELTAGTPQRVHDEQVMSSTWFHRTELDRH